MRSAYLVLGVPGDANQQEIQLAFEKLQKEFPRERLAQEPDALQRLADLRAAYEVLKDPDARAAHDRKLQQAVRPPARPRTVVVVEEEPTALRRLLTVGLCVLVLLFGAGLYLSHRNAEARREVAAQELAARKAAEQEAEQKQQDEQRIAAERASLAARAEASERRLREDSRLSASRAAAEVRLQEVASARSQRMELLEAQRREASRQSDERRAALEAQQRTERDKQRLREICLQLYRTPNC